MLTKIKQIPILLAFFCGIATITAQNTPEQSPQIKGYTAVLHPIVTFANGKTDFNSFAHYTVGVPIGINIFKTQHFGFSFEVCPFIKSENGVDKVSNFLFHPGVVLRYAKGFSLIPRLAFETSGRYGATLVLNQVLYKTPNANFYTAIPFPVRFGSEKPVSLGVGLQFGVSF